MQNFKNEYEKERFRGDSSTKWIVIAKGEDDVFETGLYEISIARENNNWAKESYGWFGETKLHFSSSNGNRPYKMNKLVWDILKEAAQKCCDQMNKNEGF
jgi:hypothetical protein